MTEGTIILTYALVLLMLGIVIGYAIGIARVHLPLVNYFREYYQRQAEIRIAQHTRFLLSWIRMFGASTVEWGFRSHAGRGAAKEGLGGSPQFPQREQAPGMLYQLRKGGLNTENLTIKTASTHESTKPAMG